MLTIEYNSYNGKSVCDSDAMKTALNVLDDYDCCLENANKHNYFTPTLFRSFSNEIMIRTFCLLIKNGTITKSKIEFIFFDGKNKVKLIHDKNGNFKSYPLGFLDITTGILSELI